MTQFDRSLFGAHLIVGLQGTSLSEEEKQMLADIRPVGILLLSRNFDHGAPYKEWTATLKKLIEDVRRYTGHTCLMVTIDHEGGSIVRTPLPITRFPLPSCYQQHSYAIGFAAGTELRSLGINVSWAPIADIHSNPNNPIIGCRAFGTTAELAAQGSVEYWRGLKDSGVLGCAKHFPGHGDTTTDSHLELPVVSLTLEQARCREFLPFKRLIDAFIPMIMTAHVLFPSIDSSNPATLSPTILSSILRDELQFKGVTVADDLDMKAVSERFTTQKSLMDSLVAGCDMYIVARHIYKGIDRVEKLSDLFAEGIESSSANPPLRDESLRRVRSLLGSLPPSSPYLLDKSIFFSHAELSLNAAMG